MGLTLTAELGAQFREDEVGGWHIFAAYVEPLNLDQQTTSRLGRQILQVVPDPIGWGVVLFHRLKYPVMVRFHPYIGVPQASSNRALRGRRNSKCSASRRRRLQLFRATSV